MFKPITLIVVAIIFASVYWLYGNMMTPQHDSSVRVMNLPWQITVTDEQSLHVFDLDIGRSTLDDGVKVLKSEYHLAWFESQDGTLSLEGYFFRVSMSGLRAKVILELDSTGLEKDYLLQHSGKPEVQTSRTIKYPLDDLAQTLKDRVIRSLTYVPLTNLEPELLKSRFGEPEERFVVNDNSEYWLYPQKGLVITVSKKGKEVLHYIPVGEFERLKQSVVATVSHAQQEKVAE